MVVFKIGGSALRTVESFASLASILAEERRRGAEILLVVSAFPRVTRELEETSVLAERGEIDQALRKVGSVLERHRRFAEALISEQMSVESLAVLIAEVEALLTRLLRGIAITRECTPRTLDAILAQGELLALHIARHSLSASGLECTWVDASRWMLTDEVHGGAQPLLRETSQAVEHHVLPALRRTGLALTQGFVGATLKGEITTMGKESSNLSAALLGSIVNASEVVVLSDVEGIRSADPALVADTDLRPALSYDDAEQAAAFGTKILHPAMIAPLRQKKIPLEIRSVLNPAGERSRITQLARLAQPLVCYLPSVFAVETDLSAALRLHAEGYSVRTVMAGAKARSCLRALPPRSDLAWQPGALITVLGLAPSKAQSLLKTIENLFLGFEPPTVELDASASTLTILLSHTVAPAVHQAIHRSLREGN